MSLAITYSRSAQLNAVPIHIEAHLANGLPSVNIVGLAEGAVKESKDRVRSAIMNSRFEFPVRRITINLAPAELPKEGGRYDLAIAIGLLLASKQLKFARDDLQLEQIEFYGELALGGELRAVPGLVPALIEAKKQEKIVIIPTHNKSDAAVISGVRIYFASHLLEVCAFLKNIQNLDMNNAPSTHVNSEIRYCLSEIKGQQPAKRALEIAAAGGHSLIFCGPPGSGKTMLSKCMPEILPLLNEQQAMKVAAIHSIYGDNINPERLFLRPFRSPHHTTSAVALVGGGSHPRPGEISLAHHGVLFLDELPEFSRHVLEVLREPLEAGEVHISRAAQQVVFPAKFQLIAAMNPCPCGFLGDSNHDCRCTSDQVQRYRNRLSGPLLDRIDMFIQLQAVSFNEIIQPSPTKVQQTSEQIRERVNHARKKQHLRANKSNAELSARELTQLCRLNEENQSFLTTAMQRLQLSLRAYHRLLRVAMTIADLDPNHQLPYSISNQHLAEAIQYRQRMFS